MKMKQAYATLSLLLICTGCEVQRSLTVQSNPARRWFF